MQKAIRTLAADNITPKVTGPAIDTDEALILPKRIYLRKGSQGGAIVPFVMLQSRDLAVIKSAKKPVNLYLYSDDVQDVPMEIVAIEGGGSLIPKKTPDGIEIVAIEVRRLAIPIPNDLEYDRLDEARGKRSWLDLLYAGAGLTQPKEEPE